MTDLSVVDTNYAANHLGNDNHVTKVGLDDGGFFIGRSLLLSFAKLFDQAHRLALETTLEPTTSAGMNELKLAVGDNNI